MSISLFSRQSEHPAADDGLHFETRQAQPTVIVKRSRLAGLVREAEDAAHVAPSGSTPARDPKVFRVAAALEVQAAPTPPEEAPPLAPQRRKRDPLRAPRLLRHEVIAPPPAEAPPAAAAAAVDYRAVCDALESLQRDLAQLRQARHFKFKP